MKKNLLFGFAVFTIATVNAQSPSCDNTPGAQLTVDVSCSFVGFNSIYNSNYWDNAPVAGTCSETDNDDAWMWFDAVSESTTISYIPESGDAVITVFQGACSPGSSLNIGCSNNPGMADEFLTVSTTPGQRYHIRIQNLNSDDDMYGKICAISNMVLPLKLLSFTGKETAGGNFLNWTTTNEVNVAGFDIERSVNGGAFVKVAFTTAGGTSNYGFTDLNVTKGEIYYYRLKILDRDGHFMYSKIVTVKQTSDITSHFTIYPNPVAGSHLYIKPVADNVTHISLTFIEPASGRTVYHTTLGPANFRNGRFELPLSDIRQGSFIMKISGKNGEFLQAGKVIVAK